MSSMTQLQTGRVLAYITKSTAHRGSHYHRQIEETHARTNALPRDPMDEGADTFSSPFCRCGSRHGRGTVNGLTLGEEFKQKPGRPVVHELQQTHETQEKRLSTGD